MKVLFAGATWLACVPASYHDRRINASCRVYAYCKAFRRWNSKVVADLPSSEFFLQQPILPRDIVGTNSKFPKPRHLQDRGKCKHWHDWVATTLWQCTLPLQSLRTYASSLFTTACMIIGRHSIHCTPSRTHPVFLQVERSGMLI